VVARRMGNIIDNRTLLSVIDSLALQGKIEVQSHPKSTGKKLAWKG
jgi:hypothetical protein